MNTAARSHRVHARGFTLLEMAIVLFILGLLIAGLIGPVEVQLEARDRYKTHALMEQVIEALYGFALTNRRLPCPDQDGDGMPDPAFDPASAASAQCTVATGFLPWAVLGVEPGDAWGNDVLNSPPSKLHACSRSRVCLKSCALIGSTSLRERD